LLASAIAGGQPVLGCYTVPESDIFDLGYEGVIAVGVTASITATATGGNYLSDSNWLAVLDFLGAAAAPSMTGWVEINIGTGASKALATWGGWQKYVPGSYPGRFVNWRVWVKSPNINTLGTLLDLAAQCSVDDRVDHYYVTVPSTGLLITFEPDGTSTPGAFNKGLNGSTVPFVQVSNLQAGDSYQISGLTTASCTVTIYSGGVAVTRSNVVVIVTGF
jgi:hypothetical protein